MCCSLTCCWQNKKYHADLQLSGRQIHIYSLWLVMQMKIDFLYDKLSQFLANLIDILEKLLILLFYILEIISKYLTYLSLRNMFDYIFIFKNLIIIIFICMCVFVICMCNICMKCMCNIRRSKEASDTLIYVTESHEPPCRWWEWDRQPHILRK